MGLNRSGVDGRRSAHSAEPGEPLLKEPGCVITSSLTIEGRPCKPPLGDDAIPPRQRKDVSLLLLLLDGDIGTDPRRNEDPRENMGLSPGPRVRGDIAALTPAVMEPDLLRLRTASERGFSS
jgi:hypothetical protein